MDTLGNTESPVEGVAECRSQNNYPCDVLHGHGKCAERDGFARHIAIDSGVIEQDNEQPAGPEVEPFN